MHILVSMNETKSLETKVGTLRVGDKFSFYQHNYGIVQGTVVDIKQDSRGPKYSPNVLYTEEGSTYVQSVYAMMIRSIG